ncbi:MAG: molybdopterin-dependent oxidoreductase [Candidatus Pacebacteria bacterium]|jgi:DMSO/TMAO reductase YedYZ molybdopterin-dependent catalytic subunit|nr:molybdopterin-dependent oxidoreductase [Candidatus Paceibacterota bacterium]
MKKSNPALSRFLKIFSPGNIKLRYLLLLLFLALALALAWYLREQSGTIRLSDAEVREYQGERLSSVDDLREVSISGPQYISADNYRLTIDGLVDNPLSLTYEDVLDSQHYSKVVDIHCVVGWSAKILWEGVLLKDLLELAGAKPEAEIAIFHAEDGFTSSLPLDFISDNDILLAYKINDVVLSPEKGFPFQVVAEQKWGYKWVKWLTRIELSDDVDYRGTYEQAGYSNEADITGPKREP